MLISQTTYYIILVSVSVIIFGLFYYFEKKKKKKNFKVIGYILIILFIVGGNLLLPKVYTINGCGQVQKENMIIPMTAMNTQLSYGKHCYIINNSDNILHVETIFYGNSNEQNSTVIDENVNSKSVAEFKVTELNYFFKEASQSVRTKKKGEVKYLVSCSDEN